MRRPGDADLSGARMPRRTIALNRRNFARRQRGNVWTSCTRRGQSGVRVSDVNVSETCCCWTVEICSGEHPMSLDGRPRAAGERNADTGRRAQSVPAMLRLSQYIRSSLAKKGDIPPGSSPSVPGPFLIFCFRVTSRLCKTWPAVARPLVCFCGPSGS